MNAKKLAEIFTDPNSVKKMRDLAFTNPGTAKSRAAISALMGTEQVPKKTDSGDQ